VACSISSPLRITPRGSAERDADPAKIGAQDVILDVFLNDTERLCSLSLQTKKVYSFFLSISASARTSRVRRSPDLPLLFQPSRTKMPIRIDPSFRNTSVAPG